MDFNELIQNAFSIQIWQVAKVLVLLAILIYLAFSVVLIRQVSLMVETIYGIGLFLKFVAFFHFAMVVLVFLLALFIL